MKKTKKIIYRILFVAALFVFVYSGYRLFEIYYANWQEQEEITELSEIAKIPEEPQTPFTIDWENLLAVNEDILGWVIIPDTQISYPIVQGVDNAYYLEHTFAKKVNYAGAIFMDYRNQSGFQDYNTFIYGHNVKHGTMFAELEKYTDAQFFAEHPYVYVFTPEQNYRCEVLSFQSTKDGSDAYLFGIQDPQTWMSYLETITTNIKGFVNEAVEMKEEDRLISFSTCSYEINNAISDQRYLLHAKVVPWDGDYFE